MIRDRFITTLQINLIVGDYFKTNGIYLICSGMANELISWLRGRTVILALLRESFDGTSKGALTIIRPSPTRWTAYYLSYDRLLSIRKNLTAIVANDETNDDKDKKIVQGDAKTKNKAISMIKIIGDSTFWYNLSNIKNHLEPLAIASNLTQSTFCRLDDVFITFGFLLIQFTKLTSPQDNQIRSALLASLNKRWEKADRIPFILATFLNPFLRIRPFSLTNKITTQAKIEGLIEDAWRRFYNEEPPLELIVQVEEYFQNTGSFEDLAHATKREEGRAELAVRLYAVWF
jgi:hypothetical protein